MYLKWDLFIGIFRLIFHQGICLSIGNYTTSNSIWNLLARVNFSESIKIAFARRANAI